MPTLLFMSLRATYAMPAPCMPSPHPVLPHPYHLISLTCLLGGDLTTVRPLYQDTTELGHLYNQDTSICTGLQIRGHLIRVGYLY